MRCVVSCSSTSFSCACILLWSSAVVVHDSQAYRKMNVTREQISLILELREILLSIQTDFNLVNAAVVCAILKSILGLEPSSVITEPWYFKPVTVSSCCPFILISVLMPLMLFVISLVFSALISMTWAVEALSRCTTNFASSSSSQWQLTQRKFHDSLSNSLNECPH